MRCRKFNISLNPSKYIFNVTKGKLLGHIVSDLGISIDPERIAAILNLPAPTSKKEVQAFMGIINFVCRFVPDFVVMVKPIQNILKQDHSFSWTDDIKNAFIKIKKAISSSPILVKPYFEKEFIIYTNATEETIFAILIQCDDQVNEKPVAYMSQILLDDEFKYSYIEKHAFTLVKAVEIFCHFILGKHMLVKVPLLKGCDLALHLAQHAEASEEIDEHDTSLLALFYIDSQILPVAKHPWYKDPVYYLQNHRCPYNLDTHQRRMLCLESSIYVILGDLLFRRSFDGMLLHCVNKEAHKLLHETHGSSNFVTHVGGHFSAKTIAFKIIRKGYYWPSIFRDSYNISRSCDKC
jgi:hypothetical protein